MDDARTEISEIVARASGHPVTPVRVSLLAELLATTTTELVRESGRHHHLKTLQPYWDAVVIGLKTFEYRINDRGYQNGDVVHLWEYLPDDHKHGACDPAKNGCGAWRRKVTYRVGFLLAAGPRIPLDTHVVFSLLPMSGTP